MKKLIFIILSIIFYSCSKGPAAAIPDKDEKITQEQIDSILLQFNFEYMNPVFVDSSEHVLLPITTEMAGKRKKTSASGYYSDSYPRYWNILFYNLNTGESSLLTEKKVRISDFKVNLKETGSKLSKSILYKICDTDFNKDSNLDHHDPEQLFISKVDGSAFRRLTPANEHLASFTVVPNSDRIIVRTLRDVNENFEFDQNDEEVWYILDLGTDSTLKEMVDSEKRQKVGNLYFDQWLRNKEE